MKKIIFTLLFLITSHSVAWANSKTITMVIIGEDADKNAIKRSSEIYKRVVTELQQSLINKNIYWMTMNDDKKNSVMASKPYASCKVDDSMTMTIKFIWEIPLFLKSAELAQNF